MLWLAYFVSFLFLFGYEKTRGLAGRTRVAGDDGF